MKARPRRVEREIAKALSTFYLRLQLSPVERIPVLGRTGPDIEVNEALFAVDVKSRLKVPKSHLLTPGQIARFPVPEAPQQTYLGVRLEELELALDLEAEPQVEICRSAQVRSWLAHMEDWRRRAVSDGVAGLVLHRPRLPYGASTVVFYEHHRRTLHGNCTDHHAG